MFYKTQDLIADIENAIDDAIDSSDDCSHDNSFNYGSLYSYDDNSSQPDRHVLNAHDFIGNNMCAARPKPGDHIEVYCAIHSSYFPVTVASVNKNGVTIVS